MASLVGTKLTDAKGNTFEVVGERVTEKDTIEIDLRKVLVQPIDVIVFDLVLGEPSDKNS